MDAELAELMAEIVHRVGIKAPLNQVHASFATLRGLREFWTTKVLGDPAPGGRLSFYFAGEDPSAVMQVLEVNPTRIAWHCVEGPPEWIDTQIAFDLRESGSECAVFFRHSQWAVVSEFTAHCSTKWAYFLLGLKFHLEGAASVAHPHDVAISAWEEPVG